MNKNLSKKNINDFLKQREIYSKIFRNNNPFGPMFESSIEQKIILCPTDGYCLTQEQFYAIMQAARSLNESEFYFSEVEWGCFENKESEICDHKSCYKRISTLISYEEYCKTPKVLENAIYSVNGIWGVIISHEDHAVLGGRSNFIDLFKKNYPDWVKGIEHFVILWEKNKELYRSDTSWITDFLKYINE
ncbi:MAG: hypothetical protein WCS92_03245 [Candidatus Babeliales bacterium]|jgi:hypothetical protein